MSKSGAICGLAVIHRVFSFVCSTVTLAEEARLLKAFVGNIGSFTFIYLFSQVKVHGSAREKTHLLY